MAYNYAKLRGRITEVTGTQSEFAKRMGLSVRSVSLKLHNKIPFKQTEIQKALRVLNLTAADIQEYFFTLEVQYA